MTDKIFRLINTIWITWEPHRRSQSIAASLGIPLYVLHSNYSRWIKHPFFLIKTFIILLKRKPKILFIQNPSVVLALFSILLKPFFSYLLVIDAHNAGVYPFEAFSEKYSWIYPFIHRQASLTIVTNTQLAEIISKNNGHPFILPDPFPKIPHKFNNLPKNSNFIITCISSFAADEPVYEIFKASRLLADKYKIFITGDFRKLPNQLINEAGKQIILTGFLNDHDYIKQLSISDAILVLTTFPDCLVCGAYEAVALGKPLIVSDTPALREYFNRGTIHTRNDADSIANAIITADKDYDFYLSEIVKFRDFATQTWANLKNTLLHKLSQLL